MNHLRLPVVVTPTRAELGARCHRRHFLSDVLCKSLYSSPSLEFGSLIHAAGSAHWAKTKFLDADLASIADDWRTVVNKEWQTRFVQTNVSQESVSLEMAIAMMEYYEANAQLAGPYQDAADDWVLVDIEQRFEMPVKGHLLSFQMDRIVYSKSQDWLVIGDIKTAARLDKRWEKQWEKSLQMKLYRLGSQTVFGHTGKLDVFIEGLHKHVPSKIQYYSCPEWSPSMLGEAAYNAVNIARLDQEIIEAANNGDGTFSLSKAEELGVRYTPVNYSDCFSYGVECPFHRICVADVDERVGILRGEYTEKIEEDY